MRVRRIEILRSAGISPGFTVEGFGDGLTIIEGRNESGKSTLAAAIRSLLWPDRHRTLQARGTFEDGGREFHAFVDVHAGGWQGDPPTRPDASAGRGIIVGIGDLWAADEHDRAIRQAMVRELHGGFDLSGLHAAAEPRSPTAPRRDAEAAERSLSGARSQARALMAQEAQLPELRRRARECRAQAARGELAKDALERLDVLDRLAELGRELSAMPEGAQRVSGDEDRRLREIRQRIDEEAAAIEQERAAGRTAREQLEGFGLPARGVDQSDLNVLGGLESELLGLERQLAEARRRADELQAQVDAAPSTLRSLDPEGLDQLERALNAAYEARERRLRDRAAADAPPDLPTEGPSRVLALVTVVAVVITAAAAAVERAWVAAGLALVAMALGVAAAVWKPRRGADPAGALRARAERSDAAYHEAVRAVREIAGADETLGSTLAIATAADRATRLDALRIELHGARAGVESLESQRRDVLERATAVLDGYGQGACDDADALTRARSDLEHRGREHRRLSDAAAQADRLAAQCEGRLARARQHRDELLESLRLTEDRLGELAEWLRLRERAATLADQIRRGEAVRQRLDESIARAPDLRAMDRPALEEACRACESAGAEADQLHKDVGEIEGQIRAARGRADVGAALAERERAARRVAEARDAECAKAARRLILERAVASVRSDDVPAVVRRADDLLARFTAMAYGLRIDRSQPVVYDLRTGESKDYAELSSGTRAQALLAMRLAGAMEAERRANASALPLVLDEPLATTDDVRFEAVAQAVFELARQGRQLVYLTCDPGHAARLARLAGAHGLDCERRNLDEIRGRQAVERLPEAALAESKPAPSPDGMSREAYLQAAGVRPLDPWRGTEGIDLYYLLRDDLDALHALRQREISTVGQVLARPELVGNPELVRACAMADRLVRAWRRGRARPVASGDILDSDAVTSTYETRVIELNDEVGGSAPQLLEALQAGRVKGFRSHKIDQLRSYLSEQGLLPQDSPMGRAELLAEALRGDVIGTSDEDESPLLHAARGLLDLLEGPNRTADEALAGQQA